MKNSTTPFSVGLFFISLFLLASVKLYSQELFFENQNRETAYSEYLEFRNDPDKSELLKMVENSPLHFSYKFDFDYYGEWIFNYYFNENGNLTSKNMLLYEQSKEKTRERYEDEKIRLYSLDNNPKHIGEYSKNGIQIYQTESYRILYKDEPTEVNLGYRYSNTGNYVAIIYNPTEKTYSNTVKTDYGFIDLASDELIYDINKYVILWQIMVGKPVMFFVSDIFREQVEDQVDINKGKIKIGRWNLNSNVRHRLNKFMGNHAENCEFEINQEIEHDKDEWSESQIVCGKDFIPFEYKVEYGDLEGNTLALAIGNIFDNEEIRIIIDPLKFKNASPEKRAFIIFHELFHTLKIEHGECGPLMFPYAEQEVTWRDWEKGTIDALRCFYQKVSYKYDGPIE